MRTKHHLLFCFGFVLAIGPPFALSAEDEIELNPRVKPQVMRDIMWVWSTPEMDQEGEHTLATWASANTVQKMQLLNLQNAMMCGSGAALCGLFSDRRSAIRARDSLRGFSGNAYVVRTLSRRSYCRLWSSSDSVSG